MQSGNTHKVEGDRSEIRKEREESSRITPVASSVSSATH
jgi:hypothetical protein